MGLAVLAGLLRRLAFGFGYWVDKPLTHDEREYLSLATNLLEGRGFAYTSRRRRASPSLNDSARAALPAVPGCVTVAGEGRRRSPPSRSRNRSSGRLACGWSPSWRHAWPGPRRWRHRGLDRRDLPSPGVDSCVCVLRDALHGARVDPCAGSWAGPVSANGAARARREWLVWCGVVGGLASLTRPAHLFFLLLLGLWLLAKRRLRDAVLVAHRRRRGDRAVDGSQHSRVRTARADCIGGGHHVLDRQPSVVAGRRRHGGQSGDQTRQSATACGACGADAGATRADLLP